MLFLGPLRPILSLLASLSPGIVAQDYLVVCAGKEKAYARAAEALARHHDGAIVSWTGEWAGLERLLLERKPRDLALVLPPDAVDANLPRRLAPLLASFDADPFLDCAFGLITGVDGESTERFVANILRASKKDLPERFFAATSVVVDQCMLIGPTTEAVCNSRVFEAQELWLTGSDPNWSDFLARNRALAQGRGLIEWGHCGDSQGIWLFPMQRNLEPEKHWPYEPSKVGYDPAGEMPRLQAQALVEGLDLFPAVVVNGSCHAAVTRRTMVGPDIVSTFGDTGGIVRFYDIAPEDSFALQAIEAGATAYIGSLAANNANRVSIEQWWIRRGGVALGEIVRRTFDELVMADADGTLAFGLFEDGQVEPLGTPMFEDCAHRVLFGDPAFLPWKKCLPNNHSVEVKTGEDGSLKVHVLWTQISEDPFVWDPWRPDRTYQALGRIYERIELAAFPAGEPTVTVLEAHTRLRNEATVLPLTAFARLERDRDGKPVLHLKAQGQHASMQVWGSPTCPEVIEAKFEIRFQAPRTER